MMSTSQVTATFPRFVAFESGEKAAAISVAVFAVLSTLVLSLVLLSVVTVAFSSKHTSYQNLSREAFFFRSQLGQYAGCLLLSNWITAVSRLIGIRWIKDRGVHVGSYCSAQGSLRQIGQFASFFFIVTMGIHTFNTLVLRNRPPQWVGIVVTLIGWTSAIVIGVVPLSSSSLVNGPFYNAGGFTCGISMSYQVAHMLLYFLPFFFASILSAIVYSLIFLILRGTLVINGGLRIHLDPQRRLRLRNETFEEYQRFILSVARTMLWLPISFVVALFPSSIVQLMVISGIGASSGAMAFSFILEHLEGVGNVLILFSVLRALGSAMKSTSSNDSEKGRSERGTISRPTYDWKPQSTFSSTTQEPAMKTVPPAYPPGFLQNSAPSSLPKSLFQAHKKSGSANSSTSLLKTERSSRSRSSSLSLNRSESSSSTSSVRKPIAPASVLDAELAVPPEAIQKPTQTPQLRLLTIDLPPQLDLNSPGLAPSPRGKRSRISRDLNPVSGSPPIAVAPQSAPFLEVTLHSPLASPLTDGVGSLISMYISRNSTMSVELPPFPVPAVQRDSPVDAPSNIQPSGPSTTRLPTTSALDFPVIVPPEGVGFPLKAAVSIGAVGGRKPHVHPPAAHPELPPVPASPAESSDASQYSDSETSTAPAPQARPTLQPTQPLRLIRTTSENSHVHSRERQLSDRPVHAPQIPRDRAVLLRAQTVQSHASSQSSISSYSHKTSSSSSSRYGYL
ncbi:hypothetical protein BJV74DRAFT_183974 [Russula compacta]|nr:hypothetical protein BJV74DRAFT_183974 [Russula compacta]